MFEEIDAIQNDFLMTNFGHVQCAQFGRRDQQQTTSVDLVVQKEVHVRQNAIFQTFTDDGKRCK
jgi:hypothetical protein